MKILVKNLIPTIFCIIFFSGTVGYADTVPLDAFPSPDQIHYKNLQFNLPDTQRVVLENGIVLYIMENHELPVINIGALVKTGSLHDPQGKAGVAELTTYLMRTGGTLKLKSDEIDKRLDIMATSASIGMSLESAQVNLSVLTENLDPTLDILAQMLMEPAFEQDKLELARQLKIEELRRIKDDPQKMAFREFNRLIFSNDPRGHLSSFKSLANITRNDVMDFHKRFFLPNNIIFAVSGDISKEDAVKIFHRYFGAWPASPETVRMIPPSQKPEKGTYCINKAIPQSTIVTGQFTIGKNHHDFHAYTVLDFIIGSGGFSSRIFSAVRNNEGLAYSAGSFYRARPAYGILGTYAFTKSSSTIKTLSLINSILDVVRSGSITAKELKWAKKSINNGFVFSFDTPEQVVWQQMNLEYENLPADFLMNYRKNIENVSLKDLNHASAKYLDKSKNVVLILGDSKNFDKPLTPKNRMVFIVPEE